MWHAAIKRVFIVATGAAAIVLVILVFVIVVYNVIVIVVRDPRGCRVGHLRLKLFEQRGLVP
jgi:hypothetical protein